MVEGPGTVIKDRLARYFGVRALPGCRCAGLAKEMDEVGASGVRDDIDRFTSEMYDSISQWRGNAGRTIIPQPPMIIVKNLILWACSVSEKQSDTSA